VVIPCCVDTERFRPDPEARARRRRDLGKRITEDTRLVAFAGAHARYDLPAIARFIAGLRHHGDARLLLVTREDPAPMLAAMKEAGCEDAVHVVTALPDEVPQWLAAADLAVSLLRDCRASIAASPTKVAEALSAGLPTVVSQNIAENNNLKGPGILVMPAKGAGPEKVIEEIVARQKDRVAWQKEAREAAVRFFSLSRVGVVRYQQIYEQIS
jgi:glycosyltransferase involved in cell wall biosynthesis